MHRIVFRRHRKAEMVAVANITLGIGIGVLGLAIIEAVSLVCDVIFGLGTAVGVSVALFVLFRSLWVLLPLRIRARHTEEAP